MPPMCIWEDPRPLTPFLEARSVTIHRCDRELFTRDLPDDLEEIDDLRSSHFQDWRYSVYRYFEIRKT
jgi:hypothetical protein